MKRVVHSLSGILVLLGCFGGTQLCAAEHLVASQAEYRKALKQLQPGDTLVLANGQWNDFEIVFTGQGQPGKPITLTAQDKGQVIITGQSNLRLAGEYLVVSGLVFRDGYTPTKEVLSFRRNSEHLANHSRVTEVVIDGFNNPERTETDFWVTMYGRNNRFDHNHLVGKSNNGVTMAVRLNTVPSQENHHRIDHNYFGHRPILGSNGGETLRIGTSKYSMSNSFTTVENNYFERCNGEVEIISNKSGGNLYRGNVFFESRGTLTLRHGNDTLVENNIFLGNGVDHTGGIRLINKRQTIRNNYLQGLTGHRFASALTIMNGVPDSPINRYHQVEDSLVENNSIINSEHIEFAAGSDAERTAVPVTTQFSNNLIYNEDGKNIVTVHDDISGIEFSGNVLNQVADFAIAEGFSSQAVTMEKRPNGLWHPAGSALAGIGVSTDLQLLDRQDTGVSWYPKPENLAAFDQGQVTRIQPGEGSLQDAVRQASAGDVIELSPGNYLATKLIQIDKPITIRAVETATAGPRPLLEFERTAMFELASGGSLKLKGVHISGSSAPDVAGNTAIRTSRYSMLKAYRLIVEDCEVSGLDVNHSFNFLTVAKSTFADLISINNSSFTDISGAILELNKETDDLGLYNAEYVIIRGSVFTNIGEAVALIERGGTDESTFGPHFEMSNSTLSEVGNNKRNQSASSVYLHGVQRATMDGNRFSDSQPVRVKHTVGDPLTTISNNHFVNTPDPEVINGSATLAGNVSQP